MHESLNSSRFEQIRVILGAAVEIKKQFDQEEMINKKMGMPWQYHPHQIISRNSNSIHIGTQNLEKTTKQ